MIKYLVTGMLFGVIIYKSKQYDDIKSRNNKLEMYYEEIKEQNNILRNKCKRHTSMKQEIVKLRNKYSE